MVPTLRVEYLESKALTRDEVSLQSRPSVRGAPAHRPVTPQQETQPNPNPGDWNGACRSMQGNVGLNVRGLRPFILSGYVLTMPESAPIRRRFAKPPLREVVLEFRFLPGKAQWDSVMLGKIHSQLEDRFPAVQPSTQETGISLRVAGAGQPIQVGSIETPRRFLSSDGSEVLTVGPSLIGLSILPGESDEGYGGWEYLRDVAFDAYEIYNRVVEPGPVGRVGVRYINELHGDNSRLTLGDYLDPSPGLVPPILFDLRGECTCRVGRLTGADSRERLNVELDLAGDNGPQVLVDIDEVFQPDEPSELEISELRAICTQLHDKAYATFTAIAKSELLEEFKPLEASARGGT